MLRLRSQRQSSRQPTGLAGAVALARSIAQLLGTWWQQDRIRIARHSGRLLNLQARDCLLFDNRLFVVLGCAIHYHEATSTNEIAQFANAPSDDSLESNDHVERESVCGRFHNLPTAELWPAANDSEPEAMPMALEIVVRELSNDDRYAYAECATDLSKSSTELAKAQARFLVPILLPPARELSTLLFLEEHSQREVNVEEITVLPQGRYAG